MSEATNTALAVNHTGWVVELYEHETGWCHYSHVYTTEEDAQAFKKKLESVYKNNEFRVYEALTDVSKAANIRSLANWPYKLGE